MNREGLALLLLLLFGLAVSALPGKEELPIDFEHELEVPEEFYIEVDALDEFIQSYYALLENEAYLNGFSFIDRSQNHIPHAANRLGNFFYRLMELRSGLRDSVTIFQIGDSHVKPGFFSTTARTQLHRYFCSGDPSPTLSYQFMGVNGASFQNLLANATLFNRVRDIKPDLIVISLGTNDAQGRYDAARFRRELNAFMAKLADYQGGALILFTLPPDSHKNGRHNADLARVSSEITSYADSHDHACWDLSRAMGGSGSISQWRSRDLASRDLIHFSPQGYMLQGYLFYDALMKAYKAYAESPR